MNVSGTSFGVFYYDYRIKARHSDLHLEKYTATAAIVDKQYTIWKSLQLFPVQISIAI